MREPAMRIFCRELRNCELLRDEENELYAITPLGAVFKIAFITGILEERSLRSFRIFDGTEVMKCRVRDESILNDLDEGVLIGVIGRPESSQNEIILRADGIFQIGEIERKIWFLETSVLTLRRMKLREELSEEWLEFRNEILALNNLILDELLTIAIRELTKNETSFEDLLSRIKVEEESLRRALEEMLLNGEIYEPKPGIYRRVS